MTDQQDDWWNGAQPSTSPPEPTPAPPAAPPAGSPLASDADATVVIPARQPQAAPPPEYGQPPAAPNDPRVAHAAPPSANPPQYGAPQQHAAPPQYGVPPQHQAPPQYGAQPQQSPAQQHGAPPQGVPGYGGPQFVQPAGPTGKYRSPGGSITMIGGALLAIIGTLLPWVTFDGDSVNGYETYFIGDGFDATRWTNPGAYVAGTMALVILSAIVVLAAGRSIATWIIALFAAGLAGLMTLGALGAVGSVLDAGPLNDFSIGFGIGICLVGAATVAVGALIVAAKKS